MRGRLGERDVLLLTGDHWSAQEAFRMGEIR